MIASARLFFFITLSTTLVSCRGSTTVPQPTVPLSLQPTLFTPTPKLSVTNTATSSATPITPTITSSPVNDSICIASNSTPQPDGWDCVNQSYGFSVHFPPSASISRTTPEFIEIWLESSPSNPRISRLISISLDKNAESCFVSDAKTMSIGGHDFTVNLGFEPSGVVYAWRSYAIAKESKNVCFFFVVGFQTWKKDDPPFPPEQDQGLDEVEAILATFRWLEP